MQHGHQSAGGGPSHATGGGQPESVKQPVELASDAHQQQVMMQPQYLQDISKTSRTLGMLEEQQFNETVGGSANKIQVRNAVPTGTAGKGGQAYTNSVIRKPPRIHRRNKGKRLAPYFQRKHRIAQRRII